MLALCLRFRFLRRKPGDENWWRACSVLKTRPLGDWSGNHGGAGWELRQSPAGVASSWHCRGRQSAFHLRAWDPCTCQLLAQGCPGGGGINSQAFPVSAGVFKACLGALKAVLQRELQEQESEARSEGSGGLHSNYKRDWRASGQGTGCVAASHKEKPESIIKSPKCA